MHTATLISADSWTEVNCNFNVICSIGDRSRRIYKCILKEVLCGPVYVCVYVAGVGGIVVWSIIIQLP